MRRANAFVVGSLDLWAGDCLLLYVHVWRVRPDVLVGDLIE
jgi:hypothetical protein